MNKSHLDLSTNDHDISVVVWDLNILLKKLTKVVHIPLNSAVEYVVVRGSSNPTKLTRHVRKDVNEMITSLHAQ